MTIASTRAVVVSRKTVEALDICSFELVDATGANLPPFSAGAHIDVHLPNGLVRQYSLCNDPAQTHRYLVAVLRDPTSNGGSAAMHELIEGQQIRISDPRNHFELAARVPHSLLVAGGIGITPTLCMADQLSSGGASFELHYCTRSLERTAFAGRIAASAFAAQTHLYHDTDPVEKRFDVAAVLSRAIAGTHLYVCGPTGFMDWVLSTARAAGWVEERLHREYFAGAPMDTRNDGAFDVQLASTGKVVRVESNQTVVTALASQGIQIPVSCEQGVCGTCVTRVLAGEPLHRDMYLTPSEQARCDQFTPCCSRSKSPCLVLDL